MPIRLIHLIESSLGMSSNRLALQAGQDLEIPRIASATLEKARSLLLALRLPTSVKVHHLRNA